MFIYVVLSELYVRQLSLLQLLIWASYRHFKERLPEVICCCLQTCNVDVVLLVMYRMYSMSQKNGSNNVPFRF